MLTGVGFPSNQPNRDSLRHNIYYWFSTVPDPSPTAVRFIDTVSSPWQPDGNVTLLGVYTGGERQATIQLQSYSTQGTIANLSLVGLMNDSFFAQHCVADDVSRTGGLATDYCTKTHLRG